MFIGLCLLQPSFHKERSPRQQETQELLVDVDWRFRLSLDITGFCRPAKLSWKMPKRPFTVCPRSFKDLDRIWPIDSSKIQRLALRSGWCEVWFIRHVANQWKRRWNVRYCWWTKSCTTKDDDYPMIHRVLTIPGGAGFPSTVWMAIDLVDRQFGLRAAKKRQWWTVHQALISWVLFRIGWNTRQYSPRYPAEPF